MRVFDPVAGGEALVVLTELATPEPLAVFADLATGAPRLHAAPREIGNVEGAYLRPGRGRRLRCSC